MPPTRWSCWVRRPTWPGAPKLTWAYISAMRGSQAAEGLITELRAAPPSAAEPQVARRDGAPCPIALRR
jgi:hypothetical protein